MNLWLPLSKALSVWPEREAVIDGSRRLTYRQFGARTANITTALLEFGLHQGSMAAILSPNALEYMEVYFACAAAGIVLVPLNYRLSPHELSQILADCQAELLFAEESLTSLLHEIFNLENGPPLQVKRIVEINNPERRTPENIGNSSAATPVPLASCNHRVDGIETLNYEMLAKSGHGKFPPGLPYLDAGKLAQLYYTSGTTGRPKGVMLSHGNVTFNALGAIAELQLSDHDTWIHAAPLFHLADAWSIFAITWVGGKHVFIPHFNSTDVLRNIEKERVSITVLVPTMLNALLHDPRLPEFSYGSLRMILTGGSPIAPEVVKQTCSVFGCQYVQLYGMTETSPFLTLSLPKHEHAHLSNDEQIDLRSRTGRAYAGAEVRVVRPDGTDVEANDLEVGEIIARGPTVTAGYWKQEEATAQTIRNGWIYTGDLAVIDHHGYINIVDRKKDMIISGGENVYSTEVEYVLYEHPCVRECAVFGVPDEKWGEAVQAAVVKKPGFEAVTECDIIEFVRGKLAHYKAPRVIEFYDELPKTGSGKIYKRLLREKHWQGRLRQVN